jgi:hypothetical protein
MRKDIWTRVTIATLLLSNVIAFAALIVADQSITMCSEQLDKAHQEILRQYWQIEPEVEGLAPPASTVVSYQEAVYGGNH